MKPEELIFQRFQREHYREYLAWFQDDELNVRLGPMDEDWLEAVLAEREDKGMAWAVFAGSDLVGVIETVFDRDAPTGITAFAVKPSQRRKGIGRAMIQRLCSDYKERGLIRFIAYVHQSNPVATALLASEGFVVASKPDENGYIEYRRG